MNVAENMTFVGLIFRGGEFSDYFQVEQHPNLHAQAFSFYVLVEVLSVSKVFDWLVQILV